MDGRGKSKYLEKHLFQCHSIHHKFHKSLHDKKSDSNYLSNDMASPSENETELACLNIWYRTGIYLVNNEVDSKLSSAHLLQECSYHKLASLLHSVVILGTDFSVNCSLLLKNVWQSVLLKKDKMHSSTSIVIW